MQAPPDKISVITTFTIIWLQSYQHSVIFFSENLLNTTTSLKRLGFHG